MNIIALNEKTNKPILFNKKEITIDETTGIGSDGVDYNGKWAQFTGTQLVQGVQKPIITKRQYNTPKEPAPTPPIRYISTGSMQRRFTIPEEIFIASDPSATVIKSRLLNASFCNLDFKDTIDGVTYICGVLKAGGIITDDTARITKLLRDGTEEERYP